MEKVFIIKNENNDFVKQSIMDITDLPRVITVMTRVDKENWNLTIQGTESDVNDFIEQLKFRGVEL